MAEHDLLCIEQIVEDSNKLIEYEKFKEIIGKEDNKTYKQMKKLLEENNKLKPFINKRLKISIQEEFNPNDFFYDEEYEGFEVYIDESLKKQKGKPDKAGYGIHFRRKHKYNYYDRVDGEQTLQNATYQGIIHVLKSLPTNIPIIFCIDRKAVIDVLENPPTSFKEQQNTLHLDIVNQIMELLKERTGKIQYKHIYSHTNENMQNEKKIRRKSKKERKNVSKILPHK